MVHRLLCCSDTHGAVPPALDEAGATAWLHGGDVANGPDLVDDGSDPRLDPLRAPVARWFADRPLPVVLVKGNHDTADDFDAFREAGDASGRLVKVADRLFVAGVGWACDLYFGLPLEADLKPVCDAVRRQADRRLTPGDRLVLLTHYPPRLAGTRAVPRDVTDGGLWYDCVRELAARLRPLAIVQGHVHSWSGTALTAPLGDGAQTLVFHPGRRGGTLVVDVVNGTATPGWPNPGA